MNVCPRCGCEIAERALVLDEVEAEKFDLYAGILRREVGPYFPEEVALRALREEALRRNQAEGRT